MSQKIIDYTLDSLTPANPDASSPATVTGCTWWPAREPPPLHHPQALDFSAGGQLKAILPLAKLNTKFCVRPVFKVDNAVTARQTLTESNALVQSRCRVRHQRLSSRIRCRDQCFRFGKASTQFFIDLHLGTHAADLVYDTDTLAVFVNGIIYSVHAFPDGTIAAGAADQLFAGTSSSGADSFKGVMAALQLHDDIPIELEAPLDERRSHPQWYLTYKQEEIKFSLPFGEPTGEFYLDLPSASWIQQFPGGIIMY
jgi:hypothetical protein